MLGGYEETWGLKDTGKKKKSMCLSVPIATTQELLPVQFYCHCQVPKVILTWDFFLLLDPTSLYRILPKPLCSVQIKSIFRKHPYSFNFFTKHLLHLFAFTKSLSIPRRVLCKQMLRGNLGCTMFNRDQHPRKDEEGRDLSIYEFCYPQEVLEQTLHGYRGKTVCDWCIPKEWFCNHCITTDCG